MGVAKKLQIKDGVRSCVLNAPKGFKLDALTTKDPKAGAVIVFVTNMEELDSRVGPAVEAARADRLAWVAYPKGGKLGTDLNRDVLWKAMLKRKVKPVRQVSLDETWSALRFRPG